MKKRILILISLAIGCLTGCIRLYADLPTANGKKVKDYDLTNNIDVSLFLGDTYENDDFVFEGFFRSYNYSRCGLMFDITAKNKSTKKYDVVEIYTCDRNGENRKNIINSPITYEFNDYNYGFKTTTFYDSSYHEFSDIDGLEFRVITPDINFTYHCWYKPSEYEEFENQNESTFVNGSIECSIDSEARILNVGIFSVERIKGKWLDDTLRIKCNKVEAKFTSIFLTDSNDENVVELLDKPRQYRIGNHEYYFYVDVKDVGQEYYDIHDNKVKIHVLTTEENITFYTWNFKDTGQTNINDENVSGGTTNE